MRWVDVGPRWPTSVESLLQTVFLFTIFYTIIFYKKKNNFKHCSVVLKFFLIFVRTSDGKLDFQWLLDFFLFNQSFAPFNLVCVRCAAIFVVRRIPWIFSSSKFSHVSWMLLAWFDHLIMGYIVREIFSMGSFCCAHFLGILSLLSFRAE